MRYWFALLSGASQEKTKIVYEHTITITKIEWSYDGHTTTVISGTAPDVPNGRSIWNIDLSTIQPATFINTEVPSQTIEVVKDWSDGSENKQPITITLYRSWIDPKGPHKEEVYFGDSNKNPITLNETNKWRYSWPNCETTKKVGTGSYPYTYTVEESNGPTKGYITHVTSQASTEPKYRTEKGWVKATTLTPGQQYILVYEDSTSPKVPNNSTDDGNWIIDLNTQSVGKFAKDDKGNQYIPDSQTSSAAKMVAESDGNGITLKALSTSTYLYAHDRGQGLVWTDGDKAYFTINNQTNTVTIQSRNISNSYTLTFFNNCFGTSQRQSGNLAAHLYEMKDVYLRDGDETVTTGTVFTVHNVKYSYSLEVNKKDSKTNQSLAGAEFEIWKDGEIAVDWNRSPIPAQTSDANGKLNWNNLCLDSGIYQLVAMPFGLAANSIFRSILAIY